MTQRTRKNQFCKDEGQDMGQREQNAYSPLGGSCRVLSCTPKSNSQVLAQLQDQRDSPESVRETSMVYWIRMAGRTWCQSPFCFHIPIR